MAKQTYKSQKEKQKAYKQLVKNLKSKIYRYEKKGFSFDIELPPLPKRVLKKDIDYLRIVEKNLFQSAFYVDNTTGEVLSGSEAKEYYYAKIKEKRQAVLKENVIKGKKKKEVHANANGEMEDYTPEKYIPFPEEAPRVIEMYRHGVIDRFPNSAKPVMERFLKETIDEYGEDAVAEMLNKADDAGLVLTGEIAYDSQKLSAHIAEMLEFLPGLSNLDKAVILDAVEEEIEDWSSDYDG